MWWLSFRGGGVVILTAASLAHARLLAAIEFGYASHFVEGYPISPDFVELIPGHSVGRMLSPLESRELIKLLKYGPPRPVVIWSIAGDPILRSGQRRRQ